MDEEDKRINLVSHAADGFAYFFPHHSARWPLARWQKWGLIFIPVILAIVWLVPDIRWPFFVFIFVICLASGLLRYALVFMQEPVDEDALPQEWREEAQTFDGPIYTILVPLFREAHMLPGLVGHLRALEWPHDRLDIKIILEEVDDETIAAAQALELEEMFEIIIVPDYQPRTKAKACNYALASARGEFVTIYDAEDQPRPDQLRRAWHIFREAPRELACLQAILVFTNSDKSWLAKQFTIEYMLQFMFFLPFIVKKRLPVFLGGSSNHFRADVLRELHGWDAYNVTEDAEIGLRLARCGYHCGMLPSLTYEEAAAHWDNWLHQRSRWIKGWLQTWLVAMRSPGLLLREIGLRDFIFLQLLVPAYILALFAHLIVLSFLLVGLFFIPDQAGMVFLFVVLTYAAIGLMAQMACRHARMISGREFSRQCWLMPFYWLLMGFAACRAIFYLFKDPFHWDKTDHGAAAVHKLS